MIFESVIYIIAKILPEFLYGCGVAHCILLHLNKYNASEKNVNIMEKVYCVNQISYFITTFCAYHFNDVKYNIATAKYKV